MHTCLIFNIHVSSNLTSYVTDLHYLAYLIDIFMCNVRVYTCKTCNYTLGKICFKGNTLLTVKEISSLLKSVLYRKS